ncbi:serine/threonine-protein kinase [Oscillatoria acuminata]|uniref:non-specific serine/threonine protein kinase n=1 Tax=Oscillatoria acuminata PCC 6304 TaxID=56110 RepID=K9TMR7_9CYAN|nr:serine/threonine-protein kinase [Oscillatoria acuminata]AFY83825.1 serine/threonine protein kinase [Oscillatoria acuminata PCC 6304]
MINPHDILLGRYKIVRSLNAGGFGQTFEIEDGGILKVLKVLKLGDFSDPQTQKKLISLFEREAKVLMQLEHPGIPKVDRDGYLIIPNPDSFDPLYGLVMEKIEGSNLQDWSLAQGQQPLSIDLALNWLKQLVEILQELHQRQYFHRDIKPSNIMLKPSGQLVLIDFGAVREVTDTFLGKIGAGRAGTGLISSGYTPPEQYEGKAVPQSDFFALGRTMVHLLTGKSPLELENDPHTGQLIWHKDAPTVSEALGDLIDYLMGPFPGNRPLNAQIILSILSEFSSPTSTGFSTVNSSSGIGCVNTVVNLKSPKSSFHLPKLAQLPPLLHIRFFNLKIEFKSAALFLLILLGIVGSFSPYFAMGLNDKGLEYYNSSRLSKAKFYYSLSLILNSKYHKSHYNLGLVYDDFQDFGRARYHYKIAIDQGNFSAYNNLARIEIIEQNCSLAIPLLEQGKARDNRPSRQYSFHKNLGWAQLCQWRQSAAPNPSFLEKAEHHLAEAIAQDDSTASAHCLLAQVWESRGDSGAALPHWTNCRDRPFNHSSPEEKAWNTLAQERLRGKIAP